MIKDNVSNYISTLSVYEPMLGRDYVRFCELLNEQLRLIPSINTKMNDKRCSDSLTEGLAMLIDLKLMPDGHRSYIIPYHNRKEDYYRLEVALSIYGEMEVFYRNPDIKLIIPEYIYEGDKVWRDENGFHHHSDLANRGQMYGVYIRIVFANGQSESFSPITFKEAIARAEANRFDSTNNNFWKKGLSTMAAKSALRMVIKWLPRSITGNLIELEKYDETKTITDIGLRSSSPAITEQTSAYAIAQEIKQEIMTPVLPQPKVATIAPKTPVVAELNEPVVVEPAPKSKGLLPPRIKPIGQ